MIKSERQFSITSSVCSELPVGHSLEGVGDNLVLLHVPLRANTKDSSVRVTWPTVGGVRAGGIQLKVLDNHMRKWGGGVT